MIHDEPCGASIQNNNIYLKSKTFLLFRFSVSKKNEKILSIQNIIFMLLMVDFFQIHNRKNGNYCVQHHVIPLHRFQRSLFINFCAVLSGMVMPIMIEIANPVHF